MEYNSKNLRIFVKKFTDTLFDFAHNEYGLTSEDYPTIRIYEKDYISWFAFHNGIPKIRLGVKDCDKLCGYSEYEFICDDLEIGHLTTVKFYETIGHNGFVYNKPVINWQKYIACLLVHEFAHLIDDLSEKNIQHPKFIRSYSTSSLEPNQQEAHGERWQCVYRILRRKFVNNL